MLTCLTAMVFTPLEMPRTVRHLLLALLAITITAGPWGAMQSFAWATMLLNNLRTHSMSEAMLQTFDGNHPCPICKAIAASKKSNKDDESLAQQTRFEFPPSATIVMTIAPERFERVIISRQFVQTLSHRPDVPPPRAISA
jgi:hypothetical protein